MPEVSMVSGAASASPRALAQIVNFHAHVYYDDASRERALRLRELISARFAVDMGRLFERPVGPHPTAQYEVGFDAQQFGVLVPWLMLNRFDLSILLHPNTDREIDDHFGSDIWLGAPLILSRNGLVASLRDEGKVPRPISLNTVPNVAA